MERSVDDFAERVLRVREPCGRGRDAQVAHHREIEAAGERGPVHRRDRGEGEPQHRVVVPVAGAPERLRVRVVLERARELGQVEAGAERVTGAGEHDDLDGLVRDEPGQRVGDLVAQRDRERVLLRRAIEGDDGGRAGALDPQLGHRDDRSVALGALEEPGPFDHDRA